MSNSNECELVSTIDGDRKFYRLMIWEYFSMFALAAMFIAVAVLTNSSAIYVVALQYLVSIVVNSFALYAMHQVISENVYTFPYGAGKLENFSAFISGFFYVPFAIYIIYDAIYRLNDAPEVGYLLSELPIIFSLASMTIFFKMIKCLIKATPNPSPLLYAYLLDFKIALFSDLGVLISLLFGWMLLKLDMAWLGNRVDPVISLAIAFYMVFTGASQVRNNFGALMDLPLSEDEQVAIMRVLASHFDDYDTVGSIYTRSSGKRKFVEIELGFSEEQIIGHVYQLSRKMEMDLGTELPDVTFRILAKA